MTEFGSLRLSPYKVIRKTPTMSYVGRLYYDYDMQQWMPYVSLTQDMEHREAKRMLHRWKLDDPTYDWGATVIKDEVKDA